MCVVALARRVHPDWPLILIGNRDEFHARPAAALAEWDDDSGAMPDPAKESRGALVVDMLRGDGRFGDPSEADLDRFNAFNLFAADGRARLLTNRPQPLIAALADGVHALANEPVDRPCPRAERLRAALAATVEAGADPEGLLDTLTAEGDPALFLRGDVYGTRASTLVMIGASGHVRMAERRYEAGGRSAGTTALDFRIG
jgi:uncharacterized protein with NRDE domain